jgi:hypothetical protein
MIAGRTRHNPHLAQSAIAAALLGSFLVFMGLMSPQLAHADARSRCQHRIEHAQARLDHEVHLHGAHSPQADQAWHNLRAERQSCWNAFHEWWDGHTWHKDNDWDHDPRADQGPGGGL